MDPRILLILAIGLIGHVACLANPLETGAARAAPSIVVYTPREFVTLDPNRHVVRAASP